MPTWLNDMLTIIIALLASSGFWAFLQRKKDKTDFRKDLLLGLAHDRMMHLCLVYIDRGWISADEYENLHTFLYKPYAEVGGNGSVSKLMKEVDKLPIRRETAHNVGTN